MSAPALTHRLPLRGDCPAVAIIATTPAHEPVSLPLDSLRGLLSVEPGTVVYVCENHSTINTAAVQLGALSKPLVLLGGYPSPAVDFLLIALAASGAHLKVHTDHDDTGDRIARSRLVRSVTFKQWCPGSSPAGT